MTTTRVLSSITCLFGAVTSAVATQGQGGGGNAAFDKAMTWACNALHEGDGYQKLLLGVAVLVALVLLARVENMISPPSPKSPRGGG